MTEFANEIVEKLINNLPSQISKEYGITPIVGGHVRFNNNSLIAIYLFVNQTQKNNYMNKCILKFDYDNNNFIFNSIYLHPFDLAPAILEYRFDVDSNLLSIYDFTNIRKNYCIKIWDGKPSNIKYTFFDKEKSFIKYINFLKEKNIIITDDNRIKYFKRNDASDIYLTF